MTHEQPPRSRSTESAEPDYQELVVVDQTEGGRPLDEISEADPAEAKAELRAQRRQLFEALQMIFTDQDDQTLEEGVNLLEQTPITIKGDEFRITDFIGRGSYGFVVEAELVKQPGTKVALKFSAPFNRTDQFVEPGVTDFSKRSRAEQARSFIREVSALKKLSQSEQSPYPAYFDAQFIPNPDQPDERIMALVMEKIEGENLESILPTEGLARTPEVLLNLAEQFADGIRLTHQAGFIHRDIKPENALIDSNDKVRLLDLGLVVFQNPTTGERAVYQQVVTDVDGGTREYRLENDAEPLSYSRDVFALGRTFQELLVGESFQKGMALRMAINRLRDVNMKQFADLAYRMTSGDANQRPTMDQVVQEIAAIQNDYQQRQVRERIAASA